MMCDCGVFGVWFGVLWWLVCWLCYVLFYECV